MKLESRLQTLILHKWLKIVLERGRGSPSSFHKCGYWVLPSSNTYVRADTNPSHRKLLL